MRRSSFLALLLVAGCRNAIPDRTPLAPPFVLESSDGREVNLLSLSKDRDVLIVFFSPEGTVGPIALKIAKTIEERLGSDKVVAIAAVSEDPTKIRAWESRSPIPVVADLGARTAMRYKAQISPTFQLVGKGGTWGSKVEGCDATSMSELERVLKVKAGEFKDLASAKASDPQHIW